ncbi:toprim domain-containing protein [Fibrivirga algicola]|uniref:Zinc finger CHC2-type domain-containing protein n=1 Tax=Fibrivirga algicola TaxID=2950420 RepID=A0ABX0QML5_9BACT|nr:toprim domain-containing protein [Fibrivirga algicola]NID13366.1 hypothetical protein [Fibrivirga algicola]
MLSQEQLNKLKSVPITGYLESLGHKPVKQIGKEIFYYSPCSQESTPSFLVDPAKNVFHDFSGEGAKGDVIRLVQYIKRCSFIEAIQILQQIERKHPVQSFSFSGQTLPILTTSTLEIISVQPLRNRALIEYVNSRKISTEVASIYLQEVNYTVNGKQYFAIGFRNDKGGYELRSKPFKGCTSPKWFRSIESPSKGSVNVFEGVFDYLSCCELYGVTKLKNTTYILNSLSLLNEVLPIITEYDKLNVFFDNDKAGKNALNKLEKLGLAVQDCSTYYPNSKDFNDHLIAHRFT